MVAGLGPFCWPFFLGLETFRVGFKLKVRLKFCGILPRQAKQVWSSNVTDFARQLAVIPPGHVVGGARQTLIAASVGPITAMNYAAAWDRWVW